MSVAAQDLAGAVRLRPGAPDAVHSSRRDWVPRLSAGRPADALPELLGALLSLCGHAQRWTAARAVAAARGRPAAADHAERQAHRRATLREQMRRLAHDWPRLLPDAPATAPTLQGCPLWVAALDDEAALQALPAWLSTHWLGQSLHDWLLRWDADPLRQPWHWAARGATPLAALLHSQRAAAALATPGPSLQLPDGPLALTTLAAAMGEPGFVLRPNWRGSAPDSGPWSRRAGALPHASAGERLVARLVELLRLAAPGGEAWLDAGALTLPDGSGLAWCEMARGLLLHRVRLAEGPQGLVVADARVLAPTEWNFHPEGTLAQALRALDPRDTAAAARLAVAFDPCVAFTIEGVPRPHNAAMGGAEESRCMN